MLAALPLAAAPKRAWIKVGVTDWNLGLATKPAAVELAARLGFEGVEINLGRPDGDGPLPLADAALQQQYLDAFDKYRIPAAGVSLNILNNRPFKRDKVARNWVADAIGIAGKLRARVILVPFFYAAAIETPAEMDFVGDALRELAPQAERAGVTLGLENTISAKDNVRILERARSSAVKVYYDIANTTAAGFKPAEEIAWLGAERICQFHLKDKGYLGDGPVDVEAALKAMLALDFAGFANLETPAPSKSIENDMRRNLAYVRRVME
jgi:sugar phosphate isomerase/epimerase